jgi:hypothetical protein
VSVQKQGGSVGGSFGVFVATGGDVGVNGLTWIGVFVGRGGMMTGSEGALVEVDVKMIRVLVGVAVGVLVAVTVGVNEGEGMGVAVSVGISWANACAVSAPAVLRSEKARFTISPGSTAMGWLRLASERATAEVAQNMPKPRIPAANIQSNPA